MCWNRGGRVVSGSSDDGIARVWDVESGKTVLAIDTRLSHVYAVIYSPDTTIIATGGYYGVYLKIWDANTGKLVANLKGHTNGVNCLTWTADGKTLISGSDDHSIRMWNTATSNRHFDRAHPLRLWHCNLSEWPNPRKRIRGQHSAIVGPRKQPAHRFAHPT